MNEINLLLPMPPSANHYWRVSGNKVLLSEDGRAYKRGCASILKGVAGLVPLTGFVEIEMVFYGLGTTSDLDNRIKPLLDAIKGYAFGDDNKVARIEARRVLGKSSTKQPFVEVWVRPHEETA